MGKLPIHGKAQKRLHRGAARRPEARARVGEAEAEDHVIESGFEELEEDFAGDAAFIGGDVKVATELALEDTVVVAKLLFFAEGDGVFALLAAGALWSVHAGAVIFPFEGFGRAEEGDAEAAADF